MKIPTYRLELGSPLLPKRQYTTDKNGAICMARYASGFYDEVRLEYGDYDGETGDFDVIRKVAY